MTIPSASKATAEYQVEERALKGAANVHTQKNHPISTIDIIDIRHDAVEVNLKEEILSSLRPKSGLKHMPTLLLYDERGLQLFEEVSLQMSQK